MVGTKKISNQRWWDDGMIFFSCSSLCEVQPFSSPFKAGRPSPFVFPVWFTLSGGSSRSHLTQASGDQGRFDSFGCWKSSFSTSWIPRWEWLYDRLESIFSSPGKRKLSLNSALAWYDQCCLCQAPSTHLPLMQSFVWRDGCQANFLAVPARLARALLKKWDSTVVLHLVWFELHGHTCLAGNCSCSPNFGGSEFLYGLAQ